jgi:glycosyltransferase involved in cell wall biosynthesis
MGRAAMMLRVRPLRIAMVAACPLPARRGTPLRIERLAEALTARGHAVELMTYHLAEEPGRFALPVQRVFGRCEPGTLPPGPTLAKLALYDPALALLIGRRLRAQPFDLIHAHHVEGLLAAAAGRHGRHVPLVYDAHTLLAGELPSYGHGFARQAIKALGRRLDRWLPQLADHVVAVTDDIARGLVEEHGYDPRRISVVPNGVEVERFAQGVDAAAAAVEPELLVYTGTLAPYQGIDLLLHALARVLARRPTARLRLMTNASFAPYAPLAERLGVAHAVEIEPERLETLPERLSRAAVAVLPRVDCPGLPQKLLNYMASGRAVVAFAGSAKRLEHEVTGLIVPNHDTDAFGDAILRLLDQPRLAQSLGRAAREVALSATWTRAAERCERVYAGLLGAERNAQPTTPSREPAITSAP